MSTWDPIKYEDYFAPDDPDEDTVSMVWTDDDEKYEIDGDELYRTIRDAVLELYGYPEAKGVRLEFRTGEGVTQMYLGEDDDGEMRARINYTPNSTWNNTSSDDTPSDSADLQQDDIIPNESDEDRLYRKIRDVIQEETGQVKDYSQGECVHMGIPANGGWTDIFFSENDDGRVKVDSQFIPCDDDTTCSEQTDMQQDDIPIHQSHYNRNGVETLDIIRLVSKQMGDGVDSYTGFCVGNILKYLTRFPFKGDAAGDLRKAQVYLGYIIDHIDE